MGIGIEIPTRLGTVYIPGKLNPAKLRIAVKNANSMSELLSSYRGDLGFQKVPVKMGKMKKVMNMDQLAEALSLLNVKPQSKATFKTKNNLVVERPIKSKKKQKPKSNVKKKKNKQQN